MGRDPQGRISSSKSRILVPTNDESVILPDKVPETLLLVNTTSTAKSHEDSTTTSNNNLSPSNLTILEDLQRDEEELSPRMRNSSTHPKSNMLRSPSTEEAVNTEALILDVIVDTVTKQQVKDVIVDTVTRQQQQQQQEGAAKMRNAGNKNNNGHRRRQVEHNAQDQILKDLEEAAEFVPAKKDSGGNQKKRRIVYAVLVLLVLIIGGVVGGILAAGKDSNEKDASESEKAPTAAPGSIDDLLQVSRDVCTEAVEINAPQTIVGTTEEAMPDDDAPVCGDLQNNGRGVWYFLQGTGVLLSVSTCDDTSTTTTNFDTQLSVYQATSSGCNTLQCIAANDQSSFCGQNGSHLTFLAQEGERYYILVHGNRNSDGIFALTVQDQKLNDKCSKSIELPDVSSADTAVYQFGTTKFAPKDAEIPPECNNVPYTSTGAWFVFRALESKFVQATLHDLDGRISIFTGSCLKLQCVTASNSASVLWTTQTGAAYFIYVHGVGNTVGDFTLSLLPGSALERDPNAATNIQCDMAASLGNNSSWFGPIDAQAVGNTDQGLVANVPPCGNQVWSTAKGLWYWVLGTGKPLIASTCDPPESQEEDEFDTQISVFTGDCVNLQCVDGGDQNCGMQSSVVWRTEDKTGYYIFVHGYEGRVGSFQLRVQELDPTSSSSSTNMDCANAIEVDLDGVTILGSTSGSLFQPVGECSGTDVTAPSAWYKVVGTGTAIMASTKLSNQIARMQVYSGGCESLNCLSASRVVGEAEQESITWQSEVGVVYYLQIFGPGDFSLKIEQSLDNYVCGGVSETLQIGQTVLGHTIFSQDGEGGIGGLRQTCVANEPGAWYRVEVDKTMTLAASVCAPMSTTFDAVVQVLETAGGNDCDFVRCFTNNGQSCGPGSASTWNATAGSTYYILVHGSESDQYGNFALQVGLATSFCDNALPLTISQAVSGSTGGAVKPTEALLCQASQLLVDGPTIWYSFNGTGSVVEATTCGMSTQVDTTLAIFQGASCQTLQCLTAGDDECGLQSNVSWFAELGVEYYVAVSSRGEGSFDLMLNEIPNDEFEFSQKLPFGNSETSGVIPSFPVAGFEDPCFGVAADFPGAWYSVPGTGSPMEFDVCGVNSTTQQISVLTGGETDFECIGSIQGTCSMVFYTVFGENYSVVVSDEPDTAIEVSVASTNDEQCSTAVGPLTVGSSVQGSVVGATAELEDVCDGITNRGAGVWFKAIGTGEFVTASTCSEFTDFDTQISVYAGDDCSNLKCLGGNDDNCGLKSWVTFPTNEGEIFRVLVSGKGTSKGNFVLSLT